MFNNSSVAYSTQCSSHPILFIYFNCYFLHYLLLKYWFFNIFSTNLLNMLSQSNSKSLLILTYMLTDPIIHISSFELYLKFQILMFGRHFYLNNSWVLEMPYVQSIFTIQSKHTSLNGVTIPWVSQMRSLTAILAFLDGQHVVVRSVNSGAPFLGKIPL